MDPEERPPGGCPALALLPSRSPLTGGGSSGSRWLCHRSRSIRDLQAPQARVPTLAGPGNQGSHSVRVPGGRVLVPG